MFAISSDGDILTPVVITQTIERVVWVRACAEDHATDQVAEKAAEYFESERSAPHRGPLYDVRTVPSSMVSPSGA